MAMDEEAAAGAIGWIGSGTMERTVGGKRDGFQLVVKADGNYITVYPEGEGAAVVDLATLRKNLEDEGITDYDVLQLARIVRSADGGHL